MSFRSPPPFHEPPFEVVATLIIMILVIALTVRAGLWLFWA
jgi:hypothetical protein